ncbi:MAG: glycerol kinase GlpK [Elusimicrobia bacterium]|nr:glycerol kinase GlpK [Elusimicrobiota bacterium]
MMTYILAIDQGTTGSTALALDQNLRVAAQADCDFAQHFPQPGWVEHDLNDIWGSVITALRRIFKKINPKKIAAIGITNQRETICFWDRATGTAIARAIVWQDRRTAGLCQTLKKQGLEKFFQQKTGLLLDPYFSGTKAAWALKHWPAVASAWKEGRLACGTMDSFLVNRLSGGKAHVTEPSNASRTLTFNISRLAWDPELSRALGLPSDIWPEIRPTFGLFAKTSGVRDLPNGIPITGILGDQQAALLGQGCLRAGQAKCTFGTGSFLLMNTGANPVKSRHRLLTTVAWATSEQKATYALEGSAFVAGAAVQWIRDNLKFIDAASEIEALAASVPSSDGVIFVPALTGLGAPHWKPEARGIVTGLTRATTPAHIARAVLEGIAFQNADLLQAMQNDLGQRLKSLSVDGGGAANNLLMQFQADILGATLNRPKELETTSIGAAFAAGFGFGFWKSLDDIAKGCRLDSVFSPLMKPAERSGRLKTWRRALRQCAL